MELWQRGAGELAASIAGGEVSASEAVEAHIARIDAVNGALNAVVVKRYDEARAEARAADRRRAAGEPLGPLGGVPITVKECLDLTGTPSSFGLTSRQALLATTDDPYVARLRAAGAIVLGKTNLSQMLYYIESDNPVYGRTQNPWSAERTPGGSSGGQAAIIAAGGSPLGLGTDIGGSNRLPAAFCGIVGFKATAGRLPDQGKHSSPVGQRMIVSQVGVFARTVADVGLGLTVANGGPDPDDGHPRPLRDSTRLDVGKLRVGVWRSDGLLAPSAAYGRALDEAAADLRARGATVVDFAPPPVDESIELFYRVMIADGAKGLLRTLGKDARDPRIRQLELIGKAPAPLRALVRLAMKASGRGKAAEVVKLYGQFDTDAYWTVCERILDYQAAWLRALDEAGLDALLSPGSGLPAIHHGASTELGVIGAYACLYNVLGWPAGIVPVTRVRAEEETGTARGKDKMEQVAAASERGSAGLPIAVQVAARPWREDVALAVMQAVEQGAKQRGAAPGLAVLPASAPG